MEAAGEFQARLSCRSVLVDAWRIRAAVTEERRQQILQGAGAAQVPLQSSAADLEQVLLLGHSGSARPALALSADLGTFREQFASWQCSNGSSIRALGNFICECLIALPLVCPSL